MLPARVASHDLFEPEHSHPKIDKRMPEPPKSEFNRQGDSGPVPKDHLLPAIEKSVTQMVSLFFESLGASSEDAGLLLGLDP